LEYIEAKNICFTYPKSKKQIINNMSLKLYKDDFTAIVGSNGSGKTTLGKLLTGILKPNTGEVLICGNNSKNMTLGQCGRKVGYLFQNPGRQIFAASVKEELSFVLEFKGIDKEVIEKKANDMLKVFDLMHLKDEFPFNLSRGEKQRLALAAILVNDPEYLILDEPTTGLDFERIKILSHVLNKLRKRKIGIAVISHDEEFVENHAARIVQIEGGEVIGDQRRG
jgi:energy-coupling factor transport system ATP-binding protein